MECLDEEYSSRLSGVSLGAGKYTCAVAVTMTADGSR